MKAAGHLGKRPSGRGTYYLILTVILLGQFLSNLFAQENTGMKLEAAGFKMKEAGTPQKMARLTSVPARKFILRKVGGQNYYVFADPAYCKCAYVGDQKAMDAYRAATAGPGFLPGVRGPADASQPSGDNVERDMIRDIEFDGGPPIGEDIFHPGF